MLPDGFSAKSLLFITIYYQLLKKITKKHQHRLYSAFNPHITNIYLNMFKIYIETYYSFLFRSQLQYLPYEPLSAFKIGRQNIFSTPRLNSWNGEFPIGSYKCTSSQKFSVLLMSQISCLIIRQLYSSSPLNEISYGGDC